jgi:quinol-cytochrome oxidoreductase complex cytochrome b subunit
MLKLMLMLMLFLLLMLMLFFFSQNNILPLVNPNYIAQKLSDKPK